MTVRSAILRRKALSGDRVGLFPLLRRAPFIEAVDREDASALLVRVPECRQTGDGLGLRVDRLAAAGWIFAPMRDQALLQKIERTLAGLVVLANDQKFLARRAVPSPRIVRQVAFAHVESFDDCVAERPRRLNDPTAHAQVIYGHGGSVWQ